MDFLFGGSGGANATKPGAKGKKRAPSKAKKVNLASFSPTPIGYLLATTEDGEFVASSGNLCPGLQTDKYARESSLSLLHVPELHPYNNLSYIILFGTRSKLKLDKCMTVSSKVNDNDASREFVINVMESKGSKRYINLKFTERGIFEKWLIHIQESLTELFFLYAFELERSGSKCIWEQFPANLDDSCTSPSIGCDCCYKLSSRRLLYAIEQCIKMSEDFNCDLLETTKELVNIKKGVRCLLDKLSLDPLDPRRIKEAKALLAHAEEDRYVDVIVKDCDVQLLRNYISYSDNRVSPMKPGHSSTMCIISPVRSSIDMITTVKINEDFDKENDKTNAYVMTTPAGNKGKNDASGSIIRSAVSKMSPIKTVAVAPPAAATTNVEVLSQYHFTRTPVNKSSIKKRPVLRAPLSPESYCQEKRDDNFTSISNDGILATCASPCTPSAASCASSTQTSTKLDAPSSSSSNSVIHIDVGRETVRIQDSNNNVIICNVSSVKGAADEEKGEESVATWSTDSNRLVRALAMLILAMLLVAVFYNRESTSAGTANDNPNPGQVPTEIIAAVGASTKTVSLVGLRALLYISRADMIDIIDGQMCI